MWNQKTSNELFAHKNHTSDETSSQHSQHQINIQSDYSDIEEDENQPNTIDIRSSSILDRQLYPLFVNTQKANLKHLYETYIKPGFQHIKFEDFVLFSFYQTTRNRQTLQDYKDEQYAI